VVGKGKRRSIRFSTRLICRQKLLLKKEKDYQGGLLVWERKAKDGGECRKNTSKTQTLKRQRGKSHGLRGGKGLFSRLLYGRRDSKEKEEEMERKNTLGRGGGQLLGFQRGGF